MKVACLGTFRTRDYLMGWAGKHCVASDIKKLSELSLPDDCYAVAFVYPPPSGEAKREWDAAVEEVRGTYGRWEYSPAVETDACLMAVWHREPL